MIGRDHFLAELFRGTEGQIYVCALRNNKSKLAQPAHFEEA
jgi:hypothetical protein